MNRYVLTGYEAPETDDENTEEGRLFPEEVGDADIEEIMAIDDLLPERIILRMGIERLPLVDRHKEVSLQVDETSYESTPLYDEESLAYGLPFPHRDALYRGVRLAYGGEGWIVFKGETQALSGEEWPLVVKDVVLNFALSSVEKEKWMSVEGGLSFCWPSGLMDARVLYPYAGYAPLGMPLEKVQQVYFSLTSHEDKTRVVLWRHQDLLEKKIAPPLGGKIGRKNHGFYPVKEYISPAESVVRGGIKIILKNAMGAFSYRSLSYTHPGGDTTQVDVSFTKGDIL